MMKDELTERELYQELWQGRDFEINHLWQRSIFLGAFMVAIAAGYGGLALKLLFPEYEEGASVGSTFFQQLAGAGLSYLGMVFSILWVLMAKGSKFLQERYEASISWMVYNSDIAKHLPEQAPYHGNLKPLAEDRCSDNIFSPCPAHYSVSAVNWGVGLVGILCWSVLCMVHLGKALEKKFEQLNALQVALGSIGTFLLLSAVSLVVITWLCKSQSEW